MPFNTRIVNKKHRKNGKNKLQKNQNIYHSFLSKTWKYTISSIQNIYSFFKNFSRKQLISLVLFLSISCGGYAAYAYIKNNSKDFLSGTVSIVTNVLGDDLKKNENGTTNILLLGSGGEDHEGGFLTDSIMVMTLNYQLNSISMLSIPRDLHVRYEVEGKNRKGKINRVFMESMIYWENRNKEEQEAIELSVPNIEAEVEQIIGEEIQYAAYIDFQGFVKIVNQLGGLPITLEKSIYDDSYPGPNHSYTIFSLPAGEQVLNGETALKYVRSRHGNAGGDFGRSYRQKKAIIALKETAMQSGILTSPSDVKALLGIISDNFWTDISWQETLSLLEFAGQLQKENIVTGGIQDLTNEQKEWFLYTPPRDLFKGQSVLLPCRINSKNPWSDITLYHSFLSEIPEAINSDIVSIYNTTKTAGLASEMEIIFHRFSLKVAEVGNSDEDRKTSIIEYNDEGKMAERNKRIAEHLENWLDIPIIPRSHRKLSAEITNEKINISQVKEDDKNNGEMTITNTSTNASTESESANKPLSPSAINIYIGEDYKTKYLKNVKWYRRCL